MKHVPENFFESIAEKINLLYFETFSVYLFYLSLFFVLLVVIGLSIVAIYVQRYRHTRISRKTIRCNNYVLNEILTLSDDENIRFLNRRWTNVLNLHIELSQSIQLDSRIHAKLVTLFQSPHLIKRVTRRAKSRNPYHIIEIAGFLALLKNPPYDELLKELFQKSRRYWVKKYLANALVEQGDPGSIPLIVDSLKDSPQQYQQTILSILKEYRDRFLPYAMEMINNPAPEIQKLITSFATDYPSEQLKAYLLARVKSPNDEIAIMAAQAVEKLYPDSLDDELFLNSRLSWIRSIAIRSLGNRKDPETLDRLFSFLETEESIQPVVFSISRMLQKNPVLMDRLIARFQAEKDQTLKRNYAICLSRQLDYLILKIISPERDSIRTLFEQILDCGIYRETIGFLNKNRHEEIEGEILQILRKKIQTDKTLQRELKAYLRSGLLEKLRLTQESFTGLKPVENVEWPKITTLYFFLILSIMIVPVIHLVRFWPTVSNWDTWTNLTQYIIHFNYLLAYYSTAVNGSYLLLLLFSLLALKKQITAWNLKKKRYLFKKNILPTISIIAPAYNEEANIIESTNSLLNLEYSDYELIVVNDGSTDDTLNLLIDYYELERVDRIIDRRLETMTPLGVYRNSSLPKLIVVDKINGGKADSLNVGINLSRKEYFCGIDSDSFLEPDALLKIVTPILDSDDEGVAVGGNIFPVNGCRIKRGMLNKINIPKSWLGRFQNIEYLRAYMAGRIGWSYIKCLTIISGAFGLFKKDRVIQAGGYLTTQGRFQKNTVGEDMELVVRLIRYMRENAGRFGIWYAYNANCWTEVPESLRILSSQRNRWHRGLIDILFFHRRMIFNPKYSRVGWLAFPYFLIFEIIGPLLEFQGYVMVILAGLLGILNREIILILFTASILLGILISVTSLLIAERETERYSLKDSLILLLFAIIENFGFRQLMSFQRILGYFSSMRKTGGWGKMIRSAMQLQSDDTEPKQTG